MEQKIIDLLKSAEGNTITDTDAYWCKILELKPEEYYKVQKALGNLEAKGLIKRYREGDGQINCVSLRSRP